MLIKELNLDKEFGLISIIMAAYNAEETIEKAIKSALCQSYQNIELIIVDDCSTDKTRMIISKCLDNDQRIHLVANDKKVGVSQSRSNALMQAKGEWIAILDSDDEWMPQKLEKQIALQTKTNAIILFTGSSFMNEQGKKMDWVMRVPRSVNYRKLLYQNVISNSSVLVLTDLYRRYYVSSDNLHEDYAMWLSILKTGIEAYGVDEPLLIYRVSQKSKSGNKIKSARMNWNTYRYIGLNLFQCIFYEIAYMVNGFIKYGHISKYLTLKN